jgi:hypothetical protein
LSDEKELRYMPRGAFSYPSHPHHDPIVAINTPGPVSSKSKIRDVPSYK